VTEKRRPKPVDRRVPQFSPAELDRQAEITDEDVEDARDAFRNDAPHRYRNLLDATVVNRRDDVEPR
jgi:hypothetical protein